MVSGISSYGGEPYQPSTPSNSQEIILEMEQLEAQLRADMGPPLQQQKLEELLPKMEQFLEHNKEALYKIMESNGFPVNGPFSISTEFDTAISTLKNYLIHPNSGSIDLLNESITQMNFYLNHKNK